MNVKNIIVSLCSFFIIINMVQNRIYSANKEIGTKDFKLGYSKDKVYSIIKQKYSAKQVKKTSKSIILELNKVKAELTFDYKNTLYKIEVMIDSNKDGAGIKKQLLTKEYGYPILTKEKFDRASKLFLISRWLLDDGRYEIKLYDSLYCRKSSYRPCVIKVSYADLRAEQEDHAKKEKKILIEKQKKDKAKYDF
jgi:hypothetical protein